MRLTKKKIEQYRFLDALKKSKDEIVLALLPFLSDEGLHLCGELCHNVLFQRCSLTPDKKRFLIKKLKPQKKAFKQIAKKSVSSKKRRKLLVQQTGSGLFSILLNPGVPILSSLLFNK